MDVCANGYIHLFGKKKTSTTWAKNSKSLPVSGEEAAKIAAASLQNSPHRLLAKGKSWAFGTVRGATFGKKSRILRPY
jgi:hypothetical protein